MCFNVCLITLIFTCISYTAGTGFVLNLNIWIFCRIYNINRTVSWFILFLFVSSRFCLKPPIENVSSQIRISEMTGKDCKRGKAEKKAADTFLHGTRLLYFGRNSSVCENDILKRRACVITSYVGNSQSISLKRAW